MSVPVSEGAYPSTTRLAGLMAAEDRTFTLREARMPAVAWGLSLAIAVESVVVHALLQEAHPAVAWTMTGLGACSILGLVGQDRALAAGVVTVEARGLVLRVGLRLTAHVPWSLVVGAEDVTGSTPPERGGRHVNVARPAEANIVVRFREPVLVTGALGIRRRVASVAACVDDPAGLKAAIDAALGS